MGLLSILRIGDRGPTARRHRRTFNPGLGLGVEGLESRVVLSHSVGAAAPAIVGDALKAVGSDSIIINDIQIDLEGIVVDAKTGVVTGTGTVSGLLAGLPFTDQVFNFSLAPDPAAGCSVLDLELGPINLDLLGLNVDTSAICLSITAFEGEGLLGDLLCGIAGGDLGLLNSPDLTGGLSQVMTSALKQAQPGQGGDDSVCSGECPILELSVGPLDLTLLGVNVQLDDCDGGPVQICVSASRGEGKLLGNLLCGLIGTPIPGLDLGNLDLKDVTKLVNKATDLLADGELSAKDLDKLAKEFTKALRK